MATMDADKKARREGPKRKPGVDESLDDPIALLRAAAGQKGGGMLDEQPKPAVDISSSLAAALASVEANPGHAPQSLAPKGPTKPRVRSSTQINHVSSEGKGQGPRSTGKASSALLAYQRRNTYDPCAPEGGAYELDQGTINPEVMRQRERREAERQEAKYRDKHAFVGKHYNDI